MKILYVVTRSDEIGGAQIHVRDLAEELRCRGHEVVVLAGGKGPLFNQLKTRGIPYHRIPTLVRPIRPFKEALALFQLIRLYRREKPDLVSLHSSKAGLLGRVAARITGTPALFTAHGWAFTEGIPKAKRYFYLALEKMAAPWAERLITVSRFDRELALRRGVGNPEKVVAIHNGMPDVASEEFLARPEKEPVRLVMVARFSRQKDHLTLLEALSSVPESRDWSLELIGSGPDRGQVVRRARELGLEAKVEFPGEVEDVASRLARSQVFVLASLWEGLPRSIIEAMRAGLPVVASDVGGVGELVSEGQNGYLVQPGDVEGLAEGLRCLLADPDLRARLGRASRQRYEEQFRFEEMADRTLEVYQSVLGTRAERVVEDRGSIDGR